MDDDKPEPTGAERIIERQNRLRGIVAGFTGDPSPELMIALDECMADAMSAAYDEGYADARAMFDTEGF
jgi:hypothetical protein